MLAEIGQAHSGSSAWFQLGPEGGDVTAVAVSLSDPRVVYAATSGEPDAFWRSDDGGSTWSLPEIGARSATLNGVFFPPAEQIVVDPIDPQRVYAAGFDLFGSADGGASWSLLRDGRGRIAIDPAHPEVLYLEDPDGVFASFDRGVSWSKIRDEVVSPSVAVDRNGTVYVGETGGTIAVSADRGKSWRTISIGASRHVTDLLVDPTGQVIYAAIFGRPSGRLFASADGGATWSERAGLPRGVIRDLSLDPNDSATLYATFARELLFSKDGGVTWTAIGSGLDGRVGSFTVDASDPRILFAGTYETLYRSLDAGANWQISSSGLTAATAVLGLDPGNPDVLYAGTGYRVWKSTDAGETWRFSAEGVSVDAFAIDPNDRRTVYAAGWRGILKTTTAGQHWRQTSSGELPGVSTIAVAPSDSRTLYASGYDLSDSRDCSRSTNAAKTWQTLAYLDSDFNCTVLAVDSHNEQVVYASSYSDKVYRTTDGGRSWHRTPFPGRVISLLSDPWRSGTAYALAKKARLFMTDDGGRSWLRRTGLPTSVVTLAVHPSKPGTLYAATSTGDLYRTTNRGRTWKLVTNAPELPTFVEKPKIVIDPTRPAVYALPENYGILRFQP